MFFKRRKRLPTRKRTTFNATRGKARWHVRWERFLKNAIAILSVTVIALVGTWLWLQFKHWPALGIKEIDIQGLEHLSRNEVIKQSGLKTGDNILLVSLSRTAERVQKLAWVERVTLRREPPSRVSIVVYERRPYALVNLGELFYLDRQGAIFAPWEARWGSDFPIITGMAPAELKRDRAASLQRVQAALELLKTLESSKVISWDKLSEINIDQDGQLSIVSTQNGVRIVIGRNEYRQKMDKLARLMRTIGQDLPGVQYVDLKYPGRAIVKFSQQDLVRKFANDGEGVL